MADDRAVPNDENGNPPLKTTKEWATELGFIFHNFDGWTDPGSTSALIGPRNLEDVITEEEFRYRANRSACVRPSVLNSVDWGRVEASERLAEQTGVPSHAVRQALSQAYVGRHDAEPTNDDPYAHQEGGTHYSRHRIQPIQFIQENGLRHEVACVIKYLCRFDAKGTPLEDLDKAAQYIALLRAHVVERLNRGESP